MNLPYQAKTICALTILGFETDKIVFIINTDVCGKNTILMIVYIKAMINRSKKEIKQMKPYKQKEIERIQHTTINKMNFFIIEMDYRSMHVHSDLEVLLQLEGSMHIETPEEDFEARTGDLVLFNSNQAHSCHAAESPSTALVLQIDLSFCQDYFPEIHNIRFLSSNLSSIVPEKQLKDIKSICYNIGYHYFGQLPAFEFRCISDVNRLFSYLMMHVPYEMISDDAYLSTLNFEKRMERIVSYIDNHYTEKISLTDIANQEGLTTSYLSHFFKDNLHQNFQTYVNSLRFEHALYLLQKTNMRIIDICLQSGFSDSKYLHQMFQKVYGMTPKEYRQLSQQDNMSNSSPTDNKSDRNEHIYTIPAGLSLLRRIHIFDCDEDDNPVTVRPVSDLEAAIQQSET